MRRCPTQALLTILLRQVETCAAVFGAVVAEAAVTLLDLATKIFLR